MTLSGIEIAITSLISLLLLTHLFNQQHTMGGDNNLHKAAHKGDLEDCKKYVEGSDGAEKIDVNEPGASDRRALHRSAGAGHLSLCEYFISKEAIIDLVREKRERAVDTESHQILSPTIPTHFKTRFTRIVTFLPSHLTQIHHGTNLSPTKVVGQHSIGRP